MRTIEWTGQFKRDWKRELSGRFGQDLEGLLSEVVELLSSDAPLPAKNRDHALTGSWKDFRDCHIKPDLILIYQKPDPESLILARLGSHSELGL